MLTLLHRIPQTAVALITKWAPKYDFLSRFTLANNPIHSLDCIVAQVIKLYEPKYVVFVLLHNLKFKSFGA